MCPATQGGEQSELGPGQESAPARNLGACLAGHWCCQSHAPPTAEQTPHHIPPCKPQMPISCMASSIFNILYGINNGIMSSSRLSVRLLLEMSLALKRLWAASGKLEIALSGSSWFRSIPLASHHKLCMGPRVNGSISRTDWQRDQSSRGRTVLLPV